jgi:hypothetical protein
LEHFGFDLYWSILDFSAVRNTSKNLLTILNYLSSPDVNKVKCRPIIIQKMTVVTVVIVSFAIVWDTVLCIVIKC